MEKIIGKVTHFYDKICVAIITLDDDLSCGDEVHFLDNQRGIDFKQKVDSMQINHQEINSGKKGMAVGVKTAQPVKVGTPVFKES